MHIVTAAAAPDVAVRLSKIRAANANDAKTAGRTADLFCFIRITSRKFYETSARHMLLRKE